MNRPPEILVNSGFVTDQNGVWTEMVIPSSVTTQNVPSIVTTYATTINWIPSNAATLVEFNAPKLKTLTLTNSLNFYNYSVLASISFPELEALTDAHTSPAYTGGFSYTGITAVNFPKLKTSSGGANVQTFRYCNGLTSFNAPELEKITLDGNGGLLYDNVAITSLSLPKLKTTTGGYGTFYGCTGLTTVTLGSDGNPVLSLSNNTFRACTQSGLTITIYTQGGASLAGEPWGATNATIEYEEA